MPDLETPTVPPSPGLRATPPIIGAATSLPAPTLRIQRFPPPNAFRMKRIINEPDLAGCALCRRELSGVTDKQTIVHVNRCWQRLKNEAKVEKWFQKMEREEEMEENVTKTICILCHSPLHHISTLDAFEHRLACLDALAPDTCPLCHDHFSVIWSKEFILWHLHACQNDCYTSPSAQEAWANLISASAGRRAVAVRLLKRTYGPRKNRSHHEQRHSFRDKRNLGKSGDAVVYSMPYTSLRRVEQITPRSPFYSGVEIEVTTMRRVEIGSIDPMTVFLRHSFSVAKLPQQLARAKYSPEKVYKEIISAVDPKEVWSRLKFTAPPPPPPPPSSPPRSRLAAPAASEIAGQFRVGFLAKKERSVEAAAANVFPLFKDAESRATTKGRFARKFAALEDEEDEHLRPKLRRQSPAIIEPMTDADDAKTDDMEFMRSMDEFDALLNGLNRTSPSGNN
ncbi:hypothetical protein HRS9139_06714 [Pyrenophora teres f. teres]|nr:hypothetical protein HRS9139_06714 [Pyrenophora teres f. teres]KAE8841570.1 hypothetical protein HRS9122_05696 [Pyrenophora teres f. teres]